MTIRSQFVSPKLGEFVFPTWKSPSVPEISIHKYGNALTIDNYVGTAGKRADVTHKLHLVPTQFTLNESLKWAVLQFNGLHGYGSLCWGQVVNHGALATSP